MCYKIKCAGQYTVDLINNNILSVYIESHFINVFATVLR